MAPQVEVALPGGGLAILDLGSRELRLGVEVDGLVNHLDRFAADRKRDRLLNLAGWLIVHVAASEVSTDLHGVVRHVVEIARRRAAELGAAIPA
jgi:very-short-patch-repair endonuclease